MSDKKHDAANALAVAIAFNEVRDSLAACLRIISGMERLVANHVLGKTIPDDTYLLLEDKTSIIAKAREVSARAAKIGGES